MALFEHPLFKRYLMNLDTKEVHKLKGLSESRCFGMVQSMRKENRKYLTKKEFLKLFENGEADGCCHCMPDYDTDLKFEL